MNKVILLGRLTKDPEIRTTPKGVSVCSFSMAVNRRFVKEGQQNADFINCTAWRTTAEFISKYFSKGNMIAVVGSLQTRNWEDQNGKKQYATDVVADEVYFTGEKKAEAVTDNSNDPFAGLNDFPPEYLDDENMPF